MSIIRAISLYSVPIMLSIGSSGCRYDGSFMQMDSNSTLPFFGLQLSVDTGTRPGPQPGQLQYRERSNINMVPVKLASLTE